MKLFELTIDDEFLDEVFAISFVEEPAIESNFVWFDKEKVQFEKIDNEKRLVVGPVLIPDKKILRIDGEGQPYEVFFRPETIEKLAQGYLKKGYQSKSTLEHEKKVSGVTLVESWIKTSKLDKSNSYGLNLPIGTWVGMFKVDNDEIWNDYVKNGEVKGLSIEGLFSHDLVQQSKLNVDLLSEKEASYLLNQVRTLVKDDKRYKGGKRVEMESYSDYPVGVKNNAKKGIELNDKSNNKCATPVGKVRAQQLAQGRPISLETIKRMHSYLSRAEAVYREKRNDSKACGNISYLLWGGLAALSWSRNKLRSLGELEENEISIPNSSYPGESNEMISGSVVDDVDYVLPIEPKTYMNDASRILFPTKEMAEEVAKMLGMDGTHEHTIDTGEIYYMPATMHSKK